MYDLLMRMPLLAWVMFFSVQQASALVHMAATAFDPIKIAMRAAMILFLWLVGLMVIVRIPPAAKAGGIEPRISALAGSFIMYGIVFFPRRDLPVEVEILSTLLIMVGNIAAIVALYRLGRSFSVMAESRQLVTSGPYRFVRHPLYMAEEVALAGVFIQFASVWTALLFAVQITFQLRRMHNEEAVLSTTFPEYDAYQRQTARLIPGVY